MHSTTLRKAPRTVCRARASKRTRMALDLSTTLPWGEVFIACLCILGYNLI